uniref:Putative secreted peptide n=1 Tax=Anopheles braziliensis TaxID=58242 RepID=A0A2M3ZQU8_9DIPT
MHLYELALYLSLSNILSASYLFFYRCFPFFHWLCFFHFPLSFLSTRLHVCFQRGWSRTRTLSISCPAGTVSPLEPRGSTTQVRFVFYHFTSYSLPMHLRAVSQFFCVYFFNRFFLDCSSVKGVCLSFLEFLDFRPRSLYEWFALVVLYPDHFPIWISMVGHCQAFDVYLAIYSRIRRVQCFQVGYPTTHLKHDLA